MSGRNTWDDYSEPNVSWETSLRRLIFLASLFLLLAGYIWATGVVWFWLAEWLEWERRRTRESYGRLI